MAPGVLTGEQEPQKKPHRKGVWAKIQAGATSLEQEHSKEELEDLLQQPLAWRGCLRAFLAAWKFQLLEVPACPKYSIRIEEIVLIWGKLGRNFLISPPLLPEPALKV